jgi:peptidoglycan/xylan/chitin deacetylase (PgdA/CDA1 family)
VVEAISKRAVGGRLPDDLMMTSAQVLALRRAGMGIGAHTLSHPILAGLPDADIAREVAEGREVLERIVQAPVRLFAYPNGKPGVDYDGRAVDAVRRAGYAAALSTAWGAAIHGDDVFQLPRFTPWDRSSMAFALRMLRNLSRNAETVTSSA